MVQIQPGPFLNCPCSSAVEHSLGKGEVSGSSPDEGITQSRTTARVLKNLGSKKIVIIPDASGHIIDAWVLNSIITNEPVEVKKLYSNESSERLVVVYWRAFNDNPTASGGGVYALGRRIVTFKFE